MNSQADKNQHNKNKFVNKRLMWYVNIIYVNIIFL